MIRRLLASLLLAGWAIAAPAQLRTIPDDAKRGSFTHVQEMVVQIDGTPMRLSPGARIRDAANRIVLPAAVPPGSLVKYRLDQEGNVTQVWILTSEEAAQRDRR